MARGKELDVEVRNVVVAILTQCDGRTIINLRIRKISNHKVNNPKYRYEIQV